MTLPSLVETFKALCEVYLLFPVSGAWHPWGRVCSLGGSAAACPSGLGCAEGFGVPGRAELCGHSEP